MLTNFLAARAHLSITVSEIQRDICEKIVILSYPLAFDAPVRGFPSENRHPLWYGKTRMVSLPDGKNFLKISLFVLAQLTNVTDAQTDGHRVTAIDALCIASHGNNSQKCRILVTRAKESEKSNSVMSQVSDHSFPIVDVKL